VGLKFKVSPHAQKVMIGFFFLFYDLWWFYMLKWKKWKECDEKKEKTNIKQIGKKLDRILS